MPVHVPLTLDQFRASRTEQADVRWLSGDEDSNIPLPGFVYGGDAGVILTDTLTGNPYLVIYNMVWDNKPLEELEEILYNEFYLPEICGRNS